MSKKEIKLRTVSTRISPSTHTRLSKIAEEQGTTESELLREGAELIITWWEEKAAEYTKDRLDDIEIEIQQMHLSSQLELTRKQREKKFYTDLLKDAGKQSKIQCQQALRNQYNEHNKHLSIPFLYTYLTDERFADAVLPLGDRDFVKIHSTQERSFAVIKEVKKLVDEGTVNLIPLDTQGERFKIEPNGGI